MKEIDIKECHHILLTIAVAFDEICKRHQIPYYMIGGTMLGAIRHQGFIPWDDDMDFGVERRYIPKLLHVLEEELPSHLKIRTLDNCEHVFYNFFKIEDTRTEVIDKLYDRPTNMGINIDIFPLDNGRNSFLQTFFLAYYIFFLLIIKDYLYYDPKKRQGFKKWVAYFLLKTNFIPIRNRLQYIDKIIGKYAQSKSRYLINYNGRWRTKEIVLKSVMGNPIAYPFENITLTGVENAHVYLSELYANYLQIPSEETRTVHIKVKKYKNN